jgi:hypothetical protein
MISSTSNQTIEHTLWDFVVCFFAWILEDDFPEEPQANVYEFELQPIQRRMTPPNLPAPGPRFLIEPIFDRSDHNTIITAPIHVTPAPQTPPPYTVPIEPEQQSQSRAASPAAPSTRQRKTTLHDPEMDDWDFEIIDIKDVDEVIDTEKKN